jgi:hypothetical protein
MGAGKSGNPDDRLIASNFLPSAAMSESMDSGMRSILDDVLFTRNSPPFKGLKLIQISKLDWWISKILYSILPIFAQTVATPAFPDIEKFLKTY